MRKDQTGNDHWSGWEKLIPGSLLKREVLHGSSVYLRYPSSLSAAVSDHVPDRRSPPRLRASARQLRSV